MGTVRRPLRLALRPATVALLGLLLTLLATGGSAGAATPKPQSTATGESQGNRVTFGIEPASALGGDGRPFISYGATPGATLGDYVAAVNYSASSLTLQVYATDAVETTAGGYGLLPPNAKPTGVGSWISIPPNDATVTVPPRNPSGPGQFVIPIELHVPRNAEPGDHSGAVVVSLGTLGVNRRGENIQLEQRVGTRLFVKVAGPVHPQLAVTVTHSAYSGVLNPLGKGRVTVAYTVRNTGNENLGFDQSVSVSPLIGSDRSVHLAKVALLLPGAQVSEAVAVPGVYPEVLDSRSVTVKPFLPAGSDGTAAPAITSTATVWAIPWPLILLVLLVAAAVVLYRRLRRRRRGDDSDGTEALDEVGGPGSSDELPPDQLPNRGRHAAREGLHAAPEKPKVST
jgi:hypothetical protein